MKILLVSDVESTYLWDYFDKSKFEDIDCVISCGDLKASYLSFLVTMLAVPVFYVHGNHDKNYGKKPPEGCDCLEDKVIQFNGLRLAGLGGSMEYTGGPHQYTEIQMQKRTKKLIKLAKGSIDILVTHSPTLYLGDEPDSVCHKGFKAFYDVYEILKPSYHVYGHNHFTYASNAKRILNYKEITLINGYNYYVLEL
ncbi:metallophosphoesterase [Sporanaerobium hydrogeniformans]|uniref:Metallophosphoesterase n=1 Tax=Sporanaerobium hydrogeniformans TaxID=3072179 RepID=A0AC61DBJ1_9FIRM|nr:metallophosphoesterase [Sporanaerobium hydrogeniformans]PHV70664.1 metallophosphoesterase [Sporanaerobium hydrogeniformans]